MISALKRRSRAAAPQKTVAGDPAAQFAHDLATQPPTKGVAAIKAASDVYEANLQSDHGPEGDRKQTTLGRDAE